MSAMSCLLHMFAISSMASRSFKRSSIDCDIMSWTCKKFSDTCVQELEYMMWHISGSRSQYHKLGYVTPKNSMSYNTVIVMKLEFI